MNPRVDLSPLDPERDPAWRERLVRSVMAEVHRTPAPPRHVRMELADGLGDLLAVARPAIAVASLVAAAAVLIASLGARSRATAALPGDRFALAEALGVPAAMAPWVEGGRAPSAGEVLAAVGGY